MCFFRHCVGKSRATAFCSGRRLAVLGGAAGNLQEESPLLSGLPEKGPATELLAAPKPCLVPQLAAAHGLASLPASQSPLSRVGLYDLG